MENSIGVSNGTMVQGFIEIEKISTKDNVKTHYKNTITSGGKQFLLAKSAGLMLGMSADMFGRTGVSNMLSKIGHPTTSSTNYVCRFARKDRDINNVLLNLDENTLASMSVDTSFVNVWDETFENADKVIGYANNDLNPTSDGKEGLIDFCNGDYMVDPYTVCKRWKYPEGVATGTINCIAMMPGSVINDPSGDGVKFSKCIDKVNTQYQNYANMSTGFLIPGVPGYTSNQEVLLNFKKDDVSRWKYNIGTGEITQVPDTENFFIPSTSGYKISDMKYIDNYLYVAYVESFSSSNPGLYIKVYDPTNSMAEVSSIYLNKSSSNYIYKLLIFKSGDNIYASTVSYYNGDTLAKLWQLTIGSNGYATGAGTVQSDFSLLGLTLPTGLNIAFSGIGTYGDNYVLYLYSKIATALGGTALQEPSNTGGKMVGYVFTDITDPFNSIIDMISGICPNEVLFANTSVKGTLRVGFDYASTNSAYQSGMAYDNVDSATIVINNNNKTGTEALTVNAVQAGVYLTLDKWWTNIFSFVKLNTPIEKTDTDIIYVSYGYKII